MTGGPTTTEGFIVEIENGGCPQGQNPLLNTNHVEGNLPYAHP
jgi:hypothetical protein